MTGGRRVSPGTRSCIRSGPLIRPVRPTGLDGGSCGVEYLAGRADTFSDLTDRGCGLTADLPSVAVLGEQEVNAFLRRPCVRAGDIGVREGAGRHEDAPGIRGRGDLLPFGRTELGYGLERVMNRRHNRKHIRGRGREARR
jgi:hypothetical protein